MTPDNIAQAFRRFGLNVKDYSGPLMRAFYREMALCQYGDDPLLQAWHFFRAGWAAAKRDKTK